jgi:hypothetical protein
MTTWKELKHVFLHPTPSLAFLFGMDAGAFIILGMAILRNWCFR